MINGTFSILFFAFSFDLKIRKTVININLLYICTNVRMMYAHDIYIYKFKHIKISSELYTV